ncbi:hypothetical protein OSB04_000514 [Centaurea solstitialis]|uniref:Alpha-mannosidase n=1 Tax=Centaurea solstitialis TaxID=347529 RepID=A0AA38U8M8_9ASTR|nr:hypothetical protein OSB04_000514 [Centaurea solstitialis]
MNVKKRVNDFIDAALTQANVTRTNHIMWTMGDDFQYQYAESWFKQMDKLIHHVNRDGRVNDYTPLRLYTPMQNFLQMCLGRSKLMTISHALCACVCRYADGEDAYWTGYFTSRPALKGYIRSLSGYYMAARQLEYLAGRQTGGPNTYSLGDALGIAQHHDAVTGTAKQHTTNDYEKRLAIGASKAEAVVNSALWCLTSSNSSKTNCTIPESTFSQYIPLEVVWRVRLSLTQYKLLPTNREHSFGKSLVVVAYNPLGWNRTDIVKIPVEDANLVVQDDKGNTVEAQFIEFDNITSNLRSFYTEAYLGISPTEVPKYWLLFQASVPPLGWNTYFITKTSGKGGYISMVDTPQNDTIEIGPGNLKMSFSLQSGQLKRITNSRTGIDLPVQQSYLWYRSGAYNQPSGAYIFHPDGSSPVIVSRSVPIKVVRGPLVDEVHQQFSPWIYQVTRVYKDKEHAEFEFIIGPIPTDDGDGKEVITRITADMATNKVFYTDSNGRDFLKRVRDYREDWPLEVTQPIAGNYYPLNLGMFTTDNKTELSVLVDRATGGASINDGQMEIMFHRRMLNDDGRGVGEALDETVCAKTTCQGLAVRGTYYMSADHVGSGSRWRRTTGQEIYSPLLLAFTHEKQDDWKASHSTRSTTMDPNYTLPPNVALITLQELEGGSVLLRLAHLYEAGEDIDFSTLVKVELKKMFAAKTIKTITETSLSANQDKSAIKRMPWKVEGGSATETTPIRGGPVDPSALVVELGPMEIRTFILQI